MSFIDWMNMNMIVDMTFLIFSVAVVWKLRQVQSRIESIETDLKITMRNPQAAKRLLKQRE
jgi:hypothetical protein